MSRRTETAYNLILEIFNIFLWLKFLPSLSAPACANITADRCNAQAGSTLNKIERFKTTSSFSYFLQKMSNVKGCPPNYTLKEARTNLKDQLFSYPDAAGLCTPGLGDVLGSCA